VASVGVKADGGGLLYERSGLLFLNLSEKRTLQTGLQILCVNALNLASAHCAGNLPAV